ncbi:tRNA lysidine(34) synthetase TilS [Candidatus Blochmannia ocreatus (nom. nud.)]|uniref:tRNA(Ile)-lysidine synthase n=1 Tax=Candidatus Blochmannia ocreatus (nom. nud.) TaxID=251538 RepID=A0ABY4SWI5_9ENTR|nr:tRNA lysidine(34) synthetase TilS [Candidatus Blochmannia ocreatus]URJ25350.1 tRNA lysidine(34) synthetase TilS [Candidatus Blochmannia ocreatus]
MIITNIPEKNRDLYHRVAQSISGYNKILLSYSGGLDSTVLLDILTTLRDHFNNLVSYPFSIRAIHIQHNISKYANDWAIHCFKQCNVRNVPLSVVHIKYPTTDNKKSNIECLARNIRYNILFNHLNSGEILLTAHHLDDQTESFFLALKRGSGPLGLSGIKQTILTNKNKCKLLRPLLDFSRKELKIYANNKKLTWIEDDSNFNTKFDRNFLRIKILPLLYNRWPHFNKVVTRSAKLCEDQENLLKELLSNTLKTVINSKDYYSLSFKPLFQYSALKRRAIIRLWLSMLDIKMPSYQLTNRIWNEVVLSKQDAQPSLQLSNCICRRFKEKLYILPINMKYSFKTTKLDWNKIHNTILLPTNLGLLLRYPLNITLHTQKKLPCLNSSIIKKLQPNILCNYIKNFNKILTVCTVRPPSAHEQVSILFGHTNNTIYIVNKRHGKYLKKIWQEFNIPPWLRSRIPLLFYNNTLISAIGVFITKHGRYYNTNNKKNNTLSWQISWVQDTSTYKIFKQSIKIQLE